ncbi:MAG: histidine phosphatase family protein [Pseudomonadota bacterium]
MRREITTGAGQPVETETQIILLRHPRVAASGLCYGRSDVPLAESAPSEIAEALAAAPPLTAVWRSPARRTESLAGALAARDKIAIRIDPRLAELDFGTWEGMAWEAIPRPELDHWAEDPLQRAPPGGEAFVTMLERVASALSAVPAGAAVVSHAGVIRAARMILDGASFEAVFAAPVPYATPLMLRRPRRDAWHT